MTTAQLRNLHRAVPFKPFVVHLADGTSVPVQHPELLFISQGGRTAIINTTGEEMSIVDVLLIRKLTYIDDESSGRSRRKR